MKLSEEVKIRFNEKFKIGDTRWVHGSVDQLINTFSHQLLREVESPKLLDAGCGNGWISIHLAKQGISVTGIDSSKIAIKQAREKAKQAKLKNVHFKVGDALDFSFARYNFDAVLDRGLLHHQPKKEWGRYKRGLTRVLKKDGLFYLHVFSDKSVKEYYSLEKVGRRWHRRFSKEVGYWTYDHYFNEKLIKQVFGKHFEILNCKEERSHAQTGSRALKCIMRKK